MTKIFVEGHGCSASFADTEIISGLISGGGYELVDDEDSADLSVLVTCSVKDVTERRMLSRIQDLSSKSKLIVAGCLSKAEPGKIHKINPNLSLMGPGNLDRILPLIEGTLRGDKLIEVSDQKLVKVGMPRTRKNNVIGIVEISSGCLSSCTFCQVKLVKGVVFSYPEEQIVDEVKTLVSQGAKEVWLTSTDNAAYGRDSHTTLPRLVKKITEIQGDFMVRIGMMNPLLTGRIIDDFIDSFNHEKVFKFLHLPLQSGSDAILKKMQRGYTVDQFYDILREFRSAIPGLTFSTDIIVGFPSETEEDYQATLDVVEKARPDVVNLSRFGARPGTKAATMDEQIPTHVSKQRSVVLTNLIKKIALERNLEWKEWEGDALVDERVNGAFVARNYAYKPCLIKSEEVSLGEHVRVHINDATASTLRCSLV